MYHLTALLRIFFLSLFVLTAVLNADICVKTVKGILIDNSTNKAVAGGIVMLMQKNKIQAMAVADSSGLFVFENVDLEKIVL